MHHQRRRDARRMEERRVVKWWDRFWGLFWVVGSVWIGYRTARWFGDLERAAPADLGGLRYGLLAFAFIFGLLIGGLLLSLLVIGVTTGIEWAFAKLGHPFPRPAREPAAPAATASPQTDTTPTVARPTPDPTLAESASD